MARRIRLASADLHYGPGIALHTASSGAVDALREVYLLIEEADSLVASAAVRTNIEYLTGIPEGELRRGIIDLVSSLDWTSDLERLRFDLDRTSRDASAGARCLVDCAIFDGLARRAAQPLASFLGAPFVDRVATNQTLFWGSDASLEANVRRFVSEGFAELKLRVGIGSFQDDLRRFSILREIAGPGITLAADANGKWPAEEALSYLRRLAPLGIAYVEQPIAPGDWVAIARLSAASPIPIMLDESIASEADVDELCSNRAAPLAHLKLVKLGGITPLLAAARRLTDAGVQLMIGQMNEGALATAAAAHAALLARPKYAELYGAYGLADDPGAGVGYRGGAVLLAHEPGLGVQLNPSMLTTLWEKIV